MIFDSEIEALIKEDVPYFDLTSEILELNHDSCCMNFYTKDRVVLSCIEEACRVIKMVGGEVCFYQKSGYEAEPKELILKAKGSAKELIKAWKVAQNLIEYQSAIATETKKMVQIAKAINPNCEVLTTRKSVPLTKKLSIKSILVGGAYPHRLGVSETILIFLEHINIYGGVEKLLNNFDEIKSKAIEKKVAVELKSIEFATQFATKGVDIIQFDKLNLEDLSKITPILKAINRDLKILSAGGINLQNIADYVKCGVDGVVLSAVYFAKPIDIKVEIF